MDKIVESLKNKRIVFWEEIARDGGQAKTFLTAKQRIEIARMHGNLFNEHGPDHLVFAAGFAAIGKEEIDTIKQLADEVENCYLAVNCRSTHDNILKSIEAIKSAKYGRVAYVLPASERLSHLMIHKTLKDVVDIALDIGKFALDKANGIPVDVQLAAGFDAEPEYIADLSNKLTEIGIATVGIGDTRGILYPKEIKRFLKIVKKNVDKNVMLGVHVHNDLGLALENNIESIKKGLFMPATSWLGLAERNGITPSEVLTFLLAYEPKKLKKRLGINAEKLFLSKPNLKMLPIIAQKVSEYTGIPIKITDPHIGPGVNTISTGTPFVDAKSFQPFDPNEVLGVSKKVLITHLASKRVIKEYVALKNIELSEEQIDKALLLIKERAYKKGRAIFPDKEIIEIFNSLSSKI